MRLSTFDLSRRSLGRQFCGPAPALDSCRRGQLAYTYRLHQALTGETLVTDHRLHCSCRGDWMLRKNDSAFLETDADSYQVLSTYLCSPVRPSLPSPRA